MLKFFSVSGIIAAFMLLGAGIYGYLSGKAGYADWIVGSFCVAFATGLFYGLNKKDD